MGMLRSLWLYRTTLIQVLPPILLLPLPVIQKSSEAACAYCVIIMAIYWITEALPLGVTGLIPLVLFPVMGVMSAGDVSRAFMTNSSWLFVGVLVFALGVEVTGLHKRIALKILLSVGSSPHRVMLGFMVSAFFLSLWMSKIAMTAMMLPILEAVINELEEGEKRTNMSYSRKDKRVEFSVTVLQSDLDSKPTPMKEQVDCETAFLAQEDSDNEIEELKNEEIEQKYLHMNKGLTLCVPYAGSIGGICNLPGTATNIILASQYQMLFPDATVKINFVNWIFYNLPGAIVLFVLAYIWMAWKFFGFSKEMLPCIKTKSSEIDEKIRNILMKEQIKLDKITYGEVTMIVVLVIGVMLWILRDPGFFGGWSALFPPRYIFDSSVALAMALSLFFLPSRKPMFLGGKCYPGEKRGPVPPILKWEDVHKGFPWGILLLVGGGFALAEGTKVSGLSSWLGDQLGFLYGIPDWAVCLVITILCSLLTECTSNATITSLLIPIIAELAQALKIHPLYLLVPLVTSSSLAFMLPVATPPNAIAFSYGRLKVTDLVRTGWMLNLLGIIIINISINTYGRVFFGLSEYPEWAYPDGFFKTETTTTFHNVTLIL